MTVVIFALYCLALIFPDSFWGLHVPAFLSGGKGWVLWGLGLGFSLISQRYNFWNKLDNTDSMKNDWVWALVLSIIAGIFFYQLPIFSDTYGDSLVLIPNKELSILEFTDYYKDKLWSFDFSNLKLGTGTTLGLVGWISYVNEITVYEAFRWLGVCCGIVFIFFMLLSVFRLAKTGEQRILFALMITGTSMTLVFCGHVEIYSPVYALLAIFGYVLIRYLEQRKLSVGILLFLLCVLNIKFHITGFLSFLILGIAMLITRRNSQGKTTTWKYLFLSVLLPIILGGIGIYIFITKSVFGPRAYTEDNLTDAIFLPIQSADPAPLDRYNLFSWSHFYDYLNLFFVWSAAALMIICVILIFYRKRVTWNTPILQVFGLSMIIYLLVFFVLNPLLSMPTDWDLMGVPSIMFMLFAVILILEIPRGKDSERSLTSYLIAPVLGLATLGWSTQFVHASAESQGERLLSMGRYNFKTYWIGSSTPLLAGLDLIHEEDKQEELESLVVELEPYAVMGEDTEYAAVVNKLGVLYQDSLKDLNLASQLYQKAFEADPLLRKNVYNLTVANFYQGKMKEANEHIPMLVAMQYPSQLKSLRIAIHVALEASDYAAADGYCTTLLKLKPEDSFIREIRALIRTSEDKSKIKFRFRQS